MATVLRVKRRNEDEPLQALVLAGKRIKLDTGPSNDVSPTPLTTVLKFAGTLNNPKDNVAEVLHKTLSKNELKANFKHHNVDITNKARTEMKELSKANRYKVISFCRAPKTTNKDDEEHMTVIDVEHDVIDEAEKEVGYVYDIYYTQTREDMHLDDGLSIHPYEQELVYRATTAEDIAADGESSNSNSESNWKNDYPDSDHSENSVDEHDMREAVERLNVEDGRSDLSSDEDCVYGEDDNAVDVYGAEFARWRARMDKESKDEDNDESNTSNISDEPICEEGESDKD